MATKSLVKSIHCLVDMVQLRFNQVVKLERGGGAAGVCYLTTSVLPSCVQNFID